MTSPREIRLKLRIDDDGLRIDPAKVEKSAAEAGASFARAFNREVAKSAVTLPDGTKVVNRVAAPSAAPAQFLPDGTVVPARRGAPASSVQGQLARLTNTSLGQSAGGSNLLQGLAGAGTSAYRAIGKTGDALVKLASAVYLLRSTAGIFDKYLITPILDFGQKLIDVSDRYRVFINSISGPIGSFKRADAVGQQLFRLAGQGPLSAEELQVAAKQSAYLPALSGRYGTDSPEAIAKQSAAYASVLGKLSTIDSDQGISGAGVSAREFLTGDPRSLRLRLEIDPNAVAASIGKSLPQVLADPRLGLKALTQYTNTYVGGSFDDRSGLLSTSAAKLVDNFNRAIVEATQATGGNGLYDSVVDRLRGLNSVVTKYLDGPEWNKAALKIGSSAGRLLDGVGDAVLQLIGKISGSSSNLDSLKGVGDVASSILDRLADLVVYLPNVASAVGASVRTMIDAVERLPTAINAAADAIRNFDPTKKPRDAVVGGAASIGYTGLIALLSTIPGTGVSPPSFAEPAASPQPSPSTQPATKSPPPSTTFSVNPLLSIGEAAKAFSAQREVRQLIERGLIGENPRPLVAGILSELNRTSDGYSIDDDPFRKLSSMRSSLFDRLQALTRSPDGQLASYSGMLENAQGSYDAIRDARTKPIFSDRLTAAGVTGAEQGKFYDTLEEDYRGRLDSLKGLPMRLGLEMQKVAGATADSFSKLNPQIASVLADQISDGSKALAQQIGEALQLQPAMIKKLEDAINDAPLALAEKIATAGREARLGAIKQIGELGAIDPKMSYGQLLASGPADTLTTQANELRERTTGRTATDLASQYAKAQAAYKSDPSDDNLALFGKIAQQARENQQSVISLNVQTNGLLTTLRDVGTEGRNALETGLGAAFDALITRTGSFSDAIRGLARSLASAFADSSARQLIQAVLGDSFKGQSNGGFGSGGGLIGSLVAGFAQSYGASSTTVVAAANGGIIPPQIKAYAAGAVVRTPTLSLVGERPDGVPEAVIPMLGYGGRIPLRMDDRGSISARLPGGRSIAAVLENHTRAYAEGGVMGNIWAGRGPSHVGGGGMYVPEHRNFEQGDTSPKIYVVSDVQEAVRYGFVKHSDTLVSLMTSNINKGGRLGKAVRR